MFQIIPISRIITDIGPFFHSWDLVTYSLCVMQIVLHQLQRKRWERKIGKLNWGAKHEKSTPELGLSFANLN